jgi:hypothetical protein
MCVIVIRSLISGEEKQQFLLQAAGVAGWHQETEKREKIR